MTQFLAAGKAAAALGKTFQAEAEDVRPISNFSAFFRIAHAVAYISPCTVVYAVAYALAYTIAYTVSYAVSYTVAYSVANVVAYANGNPYAFALAIVALAIVTYAVPYGVAYDFPSIFCSSALSGS